MNGVLVTNQNTHGTSKLPPKNKNKGEDGKSSMGDKTPVHIRTDFDSSSFGTGL